MNKLIENGTIRRFECVVPIGEVLPQQDFQIGMRVVAPPPGAPAPHAVVYCLPGGQMDRTYFDLGSAGDRRFSLAEALAEHGMVAILADHPGIGDSTCPDDPFDITPDLIAEAHARSARAALDRLASGTLVAGLEPLPGLTALGCGHSMGAVAMIAVQARAPLFAGIALLGHGNGGLPDSFPADLTDAARDLDWLEANLPSIAQHRFGGAVFDHRKAPRKEPRENGPSFHTGSADPDGRAALRGAVAPLLTVPGLHSMFPGVSDRASKTIEVPVLVVTGADDFADTGEELRDHFPKAADYQRFAPPDTGHNLFIFPSRVESFARIAGWAASLAQGNKGN